MTSIYKYPLVMVDCQHVEMPAGSKILSADNQRGVLCLWALVDTDETMMMARCIEISGTGQSVVDVNRLRHIDTVIIEPFVWHVFERTLLVTSEVTDE